MNVIKKDGTLEPYNFEKIRAAVSKSAGRVMVTLTDGDFRVIKAMVENKLNLMGKENVPIADMHNVVEGTLEEFNPTVAKSYKDHINMCHTQLRHSRLDFAHEFSPPFALIYRTNLDEKRILCYYSYYH